MLFLISGIFGAFLAVLCFVLGFFVGKSAGRAAPAAPVEPSPEARQKQEEERKAYTDLFSYNAETAYGYSKGGDAYGSFQL